MTCREWVDAIRIVATAASVVGVTWAIAWGLRGLVRPQR
jgi:hypothetical protein